MHIVIGINCVVLEITLKNSCFEV